MSRLLRIERPRLFFHHLVVAGVGLFQPAMVLAQTSAPLYSTQTRSPSTAGVAQAPAQKPALETRPELIVLNALRSNPVTAPYPIATSWRSGQVVLSGRVGTKVVHDVAVQLGIAAGYSIRDELKIDTTEVYRSGAWGPTIGVTPNYVYPPPLFGRIDEPFFGFEPPLLSYPPWWGAVAAREPIRLPPGTLDQGSADPGAVGQAAETPAPAPVHVPIGPGPDDGTIEMTLDTRGVAVLRGTVPTLADRVAVGQKIMQTPGVTQVVNLLNVGPAEGANATPSPAKPPQPEPPPPPQPENAPELRRPDRQEPEADDRPIQPSITADNAELSERLFRALQNRPVLAAQPIKVAVRDGVASLSGEVPTAYEAMLAFRAVQQTPGVREVDDRLQFVVPDGERRNPLELKGRPEDVEPYLTAQIRRQVGDIAHIDQVRVQGASLEIKGTLVREDDRARLDAILRSMPLLRGFRLEPSFVVD